MAGRQPFVNPGGLNLFPVFENDVVNRNPHQFLNPLRGLGMPQVQPNMNRESYNQDYRGERMGFSDNYDNNYDHYYGREQMASNDRGAQRTLRESSDSRNHDGGDYPHQDRGRIRGLMDREIPLDCLFPEMESARHDERHGREEFERGNYRASKTNLQSGPFRSQSETHVDSSHDKSKDVKLSPNEIKYGKRDNTAIPWNAQLRPNCYLVPPLDDTHVQPLSERQPGCCTVFVGGLPGLADEFIIKEIFNVCGLVENISYKNVRKNTQVRYCQVRFYKQDSVEKAVKFNGHVLVIGDGSDRKAKISRIRVNYDKETNDNKMMKTNITVNRKKPVQKEAQTHSEDLMYNRKKAFQVLDLIRHDTSIVESLEMMAHWFEKGECNRTTVNVFHTMLSTTHSLVKRLISKRKEHEQRVEKQKMQAVERANEIKQQCEAVWKVFEAASKQKSWDNFTKGQRKTIAQWHAVIRKEIRSAQEAEIQNREEVGMDLDDEVPNLGGLIEQPALQMAEGHQNEQEDESLSPSKAKKQRRDASESDADSTDALKLENAKLRTQVGSLKGIAEQNTNLLWSMQSYQYQADMTRQQYSDRLIEKDQEIIRLHKALQHMKQKILLSDPQAATSDQLADMQIVVELSKDHQTATMDEVAVRYEEDSKENDGEAMKEAMMGDEDGRKVEETIESHNKVEEKESGEQIRGNEGVSSEREDLNNKEGSFLPSQIAKGDSECEGVPIQKENSEIELAEMSIEEGKEVGVLAEEEEIPAEEVEKPLEDDANLAEEGEKPIEGVTPVEGEKPIERGTSIQEEENPTEQEENEDDVDPGEEDKRGEGSGRFVQIDDEQFEVIDDMDEDSEDDYKEVAAHSALNENVEQMSEQLPSDDAYKEVAACSLLIGNDEQVKEQLPSKDDYKEVAAHSSMNENVEQVNQQLPSKDDYEEATAHSAMNQNVEQVNEQLPADLSDYQQDYSAQYQTWPLAGMASYGSMDFGPSLVRLSGEELVLVGIMCSYLHLCPSGATSGEIRDYLSRQFKEHRKDVVEKLLFSLPILFKAGESSGNTKWKFCGFEMAQSKSEN